MSRCRAPEKRVRVKFGVVRAIGKTSEQTCAYIESYKQSESEAERNKIVGEWLAPRAEFVGYLRSFSDLQFRTLDGKLCGGGTLPGDVVVTLEELEQFKKPVVK